MTENAGFWFESFAQNDSLPNVQFHSSYFQRSYLVGGLEHFLIFPFSWECHHPN